MTRYKLAQLIRSYTKQNATSLADADILLLINAEKDNLSELIASRDLKGNYFILPTLDNLIAGQREYAQPDDVLDQIFSVEFAFSPTLNSFGELNYIKALPDNFERHKVSRTEQNIQRFYDNSEGGVAYSIQRRSLYLLSGAIDSTTLGGANVVNGIRLRYRSYPADLTDVTDNITDMSVDPTTTTFGFPRQFHELLARRCAIVWKAQNPGAVPASQLEAMYPDDLEKKLEAMNSPDLGGELLSDPTPSSDGADGYNL